jgi:hypothetical protein
MPGYIFYTQTVPNIHVSFGILSTSCEQTNNKLGANLLIKTNHPHWFEGSTRCCSSSYEEESHIKLHSIYQPTLYTSPTLSLYLKTRIGYFFLLCQSNEKFEKCFSHCTLQYTRMNETKKNRLKTHNRIERAQSGVHSLAAEALHSWN